MIQERFGYKAKAKVISFPVIANGAFYNGILEYEVSLNGNSINDTLDMITGIDHFNSKARTHTLVVLRGLPYFDSPSKQCIMCRNTTHPAIISADIMVTRGHDATTVLTKMHRCRNTDCKFTYFDNKQFVQFLTSARNQLS